MLKLKDNVDLKELEKYGFIFKSNIFWIPLKKSKELIALHINLHTREIDCLGILGPNEKTDDLYELIIDGLVEKVKND